MRPVSVVVPALGDTELLERNLPSLFEAFAARGAGDELLLVDDTGSGELEPWAETWLADKPAKLVVQTANGGFAEALVAGVAAADHGLVFSMNSDVRVRTGFLEPLVQAFSEAPGDDVFAVVPRVELDGDPNRVESLMRARLVEGLLDMRGGDPGAPPTSTTAVPFAVGGTMLFDRVRFAELGGFDTLFAPFYFEDVDLCWRAWRRGWRTLFVPDSVVEHHHKGTIGKHLDEQRRRAAVERGELLFNWKQLDEADLPAHMAQLYRRALDAYLTDDRAELIWLGLALDRLQAAAEARELVGRSASRSTRAVLEDLAGGASGSSD